MPLPSLEAWNREMRVTSSTAIAGSPELKQAKHVIERWNSFPIEIWTKPLTRSEVDAIRGFVPSSYHDTETMLNRRNTHLALAFFFEKGFPIYEIVKMFVQFREALNPYLIKNDLSRYSHKRIHKFKFIDEVNQYLDYSISILYEMHERHPNPMISEPGLDAMLSMYSKYSKIRKSREEISEDKSLSLAPASTSSQRR